MEKGIFCISLDTELFWGVHDTATYSSYGENIYNGHVNVIPRILVMFNKYGIHASWAIVGATMAKNKEDLVKHLPSKNKWPTYDNMDRSPYGLLDEIGIDEEKDKLYLGTDIIEKIRKTRNQYIGSHTFSHYYCGESGQTKEQFEADIQSALSISNALGIDIYSIVFPKNEINDEYVELCKNNGFSVYRGIEENWIYKIDNHTFLHRVMRFLDSYFPLSGSNVFCPELKNGLLNVRGSRILRPYNDKLKIIEKLKIHRIKGQMKKAARRKKVFHLWWHPHNFGKNMDENFDNLKCILDYYMVLNRKYGYQSKSMEEIAFMYGGDASDNI